MTFLSTLKKSASTAGDILTSKGDILTRTASALARLGVGSNDQVIIADSSETSGLKWGATAGLGANTFTADQIIGNVNADPELSLRRDSTTPAGNDLVGSILFQGDDSDNNVTTYSRFRNRARVVTDGAEEGRIQFEVLKAGALTVVAEINNVAGRFEIKTMDLEIDATKKLYLDGGGDTYIAQGSVADNVEHVVGGQIGLELWETGNVVSTIVGNQALLSTSATNGFMYIPACAGTPTGTPTSWTGKSPMVFDASNNKLYIYNSGWKSTTLS